MNDIRTAIDRSRDESWMREALALASTSATRGEVPVGAIVVLDERIIGRGHNETIATSDPSAHAEIVALRDAGRVLGVPRFPGATLYVTLEPCLMCLGAMVHARIARLVFAAPDPKVRATEILASIPDDRAGLNHRFAIDGGVMAEDAAALLRAFFRERR